MRLMRAEKGVGALSPRPNTPGGGAMLLPLIFCHIAFLVSSRNMDWARKLKTQVDYSHEKRTKSSADRAPTKPKAVHT